MSQLQTLPSQPNPGRESSSARVKVCHVSLTLCTGGLERLLVDFARYHDRRRYSLLFVALGETGNPAEEIREAGGEVISLACTGKGKLTQVQQLSELFRRENVQVVHTHNAYPHLYGTVAARWARVPAVVHSRHGRRFGENFSERMQFALAGRLADRIVAVSDDTARLCEQLGRFDGQKVMRIWNGIDVDRFVYHGPIKEPAGISVARLSAEKDFQTLLRACVEIKREIPEFRLMIVGDGPERERLENCSQEWGLNDTVEFLGERSDVPDLLSQAGFFVSSSRTEGISLTLLEAMATGLPVIATQVGGNPEIVAAGSTGILVPPENPDGLASAVISLWNDRPRWDNIGRAGRDRVERHFGIRGMIRDYESLYQELLPANSKCR